MANEWGVGLKGKNNGVLVLFSAKLREVHIQNGDGVRERLTDKETQIIIDEIMIEQFKEGAYYDGLKAGLEEITAQLKETK